ncbi:DHHW family protein [Paenibacillus sp. GCM10027626]|uniref:DHHW family protein n=1 Tax=Paenibacillus sp. GCM10027626 TaxID=3273411 RepID=UPI003629EDA2
MKFKNRTLVIAAALLTLLIVVIYVVITQSSATTPESKQPLAQDKGEGSGEKGNVSKQEEQGDGASETGKETEGKDKGVIIDINGARYMIFKDRAVTLFHYSETAADKYADVLNQFRSAVPESVNVYSMLVPTSADFVNYEQSGATSDSQKNALAHIQQKLDKKVNVVDVYGTLAEHQKEYVYFRTDHHWTALGAYYSYVKLMENMGMQPVALSEYEEGKIEQFLGTMYKTTKSETLKQHPDTISYYMPKDDYSFEIRTTTGKMVKRNLVDPKYAQPEQGFYGVFLGGDAPMGEVTTSNKNGKSIVVIKDSYGNAFIPFLVPHYEKVFFIDPRSFAGSISQFVKERQITDVLFLNNSTVARHSGIADLILEKM